jgi:glycosyltransferase involved in cell wall biosynthesis
MKPRLHILANPHGITDLTYRMEPFNIAVAKMIANLVPRGYEILHYGHELSDVACETVPVVHSNEVFPRGEDDLFEHNPAIVKIFCRRSREQLLQRYRPGDLILCFYGIDNQEAVAGIPNATVVEPSIGYRPECVFAPYRVFTSQAQMHYFYGQNNMLLNPSWYDDVIPNAFTPAEFEFSDNKDDYCLYLGRISADKGIHLAIQMTQYTGQKLVIAGPGDLSGLGYSSVPDHVTMVGYVNVEQRRRWLRDARVLIAPTHYLEPFGNIVVEAFMSGTPAITTDWGGFVDTNQQGITGFRCKDFLSFVNAMQRIDQIDHQACRDWAIGHFSDDVVHDRFDQYFQRIAAGNFYHGTNLQSR